MSRKAARHDEHADATSCEERMNAMKAEMADLVCKTRDAVRTARTMQLMPVAAAALQAWLRARVFAFEADLVVNVDAITAPAATQLAFDWPYDLAGRMESTYLLRVAFRITVGGETAQAVLWLCDCQQHDSSFGGVPAVSLGFVASDDTELAVHFAPSMPFDVTRFDCPSGIDPKSVPARVLFLLRGSVHGRHHLLEVCWALATFMTEDADYDTPAYEIRDVFVKREYCAGLDNPLFAQMTGADDAIYERLCAIAGGPAW